jgi:cellobiose phosphorylase
VPVSRPASASAGATRSEPARPSAAPAEGVRRLSTAADFASTRLRSDSGLTAQIAASGALFALRHGPTLINQFLPGPAEDGFLRLMVRWRTAGSFAWAPLVGPGIPHRVIGPASAQWVSAPRAGWVCTATLALHAEKSAWAWSVRIENATAQEAVVDVTMAQDLGLGDEAAVRNSEAFNSQYVDLLPLEDPRLGWVILARQNLEMGEGRHPWLAAGCAGGAASFCTDATQFFGADHRLTGSPAALGLARLPSRRLQGESALAGLQSGPRTVGPGATAKIEFVCRFQADHPSASSESDLESLREVLPASWAEPPGAEGASLRAEPASIFATAPWLHGARPSEGDWTGWFPGRRRHEEVAPDGAVLSFFSGDSTHVVSRDKEAAVARPSGHILRSGAWRWIEPEQVGTTCYAAGVFSSQAYLGNQSLALLLPVVRDFLGVGRASGQRVFIRGPGGWQQLGVPSAFAMTPSDARWIYRIGRDVVEARVWCSRGQSAAFLDLRVRDGGGPAEFLVTHTLALGANEFDLPGTVQLFGSDGWALCKPDPASVVGGLIPGACFAIACAEAGRGAELACDGALYVDGADRGFSCVALRQGPASRMGVILCGSLNGPGALKALVEAARGEWRRGAEPAGPPQPPVRLSAPPAADPPGRGVAAGVARLDEILPWFVHNAAVHFSAPHGLEQHGGAAWGVRDVCQGSVEWLLSAGQWSVARRALETVFQQQYAFDGSWPQWFMHPPYQRIRQADSHGDVCFWPVKALCDYVEASNDLDFLRWRTGYTSPEGFEPCGPEESLLQHCDRVVDLCETRFVPGTALVNYGDGDWDDTLRPAEPGMRTRMVSSWTVGLAYHTFRQLAELYRRIGEPVRLSRTHAILARMRRDFAGRLMPRGIVAGFVVSEADGTFRPLLHPDDSVTAIRYRLLPMTRGVLSEVFTAEEAARHMKIVAGELLYPDGVRLMSEPAAYHGGCERLFKRADTAANVGREIGLQYVHAHIRYAEALAKMGDADRLWAALQVVNPVALAESVPNALPRQSNVYFSSSDADFGDRVEAARRWAELKSGAVAVRGGWRLYSSGPGLYVHKVRTCLLGLRESFGDIVFDPVLPRALDGLVARATLFGRTVKITYRVRQGVHSPSAVHVNGVAVKESSAEANPYRKGGLRVRESALRAHLSAGENSITVEL